MSYNPEASIKTSAKNLSKALLLEDVKALRQLLEMSNLTLEDYHELLFFAVDLKPSKETFIILVETFNKKNISLDVCNVNNRTALDNAFLDGYFDGIEALIKGGADYQRKMRNSENSYLDFYRENRPKMAHKINDLIRPNKDKNKSSQDDTVVFKLFRFLKNSFGSTSSAGSTYSKLVTGDDEKTQNSSSYFSQEARSQKAKID